MGVAPLQVYVIHRRQLPPLEAMHAVCAAQCATWMRWQVFFITQTDLVIDFRTSCVPQSAMT